MDLITYSISKIRKSIPKEILDIRYNVAKDIYTNVNTNIEDIVFNGDVLVDMNLISVNNIVVSLDKLVYLGQYGDKKLYDVPESLTNGLSIIDVIGVIAGNAFGGMKGDVFVDNTVRAYLINRHTISIDEEFFSIQDAQVELTLAYDNRMKAIMPSSYPILAKAFILATKADIYNELIIPLNEGALYYGHDLPSLKSIVDEYADSRELYDEYMKETVAGVLFMSTDEVATEWVTGLLPNTN